MDKVLIVEKDPVFFNMLDVGLKRLQQFGVYGACDLKTAVEILSCHRIDVVVVGLEVRKFNTFALLSHMSRNHQKTPCIVMSDRGKPWFRNCRMQESFIYYLEKPFQISALASAIVVGLNLQDMGANACGMKMSSLLPLAELVRLTGHMKISAFDRRKGNLFFSDGILLDADCGDVTGEVAAREIAGWNRCSFQFSSLPENRRTRRIEATSMEIAGATWIRNDAVIGKKTGSVPGEKIVVLDDIIELTACAEPVMNLRDVIQEWQRPSLYESPGESLERILLDIRMAKGYLSAFMMDEEGVILASDGTHPETLLSDERSGGSSGRSSGGITDYIRRIFTGSAFEGPDALTLHNRHDTIVAQRVFLESIGSVFVVVRCSAGGNWYYTKIRLHQFAGRKIADRESLRIKNRPPRRPERPCLVSETQ